MNSLPRKNDPSQKPSSEQTAAKAASHADPHHPLRSSVPLVFVTRVEFDGVTRERLAQEVIEFDRSRLLLNRLRALKAALRKVDEMRRKAARALEELR